jgi:hypothetical protein
MSVEGNVVPVAIQVMAQTVDSIVSQEDSVWIHHRENLEDDIFS